MRVAHAQALEAHCLARTIAAALPCALPAPCPLPLPPAACRPPLAACRPPLAACPRRPEGVPRTLEPCLSAAAATTAQASQACLIALNVCAVKFDAYNVDRARTAGVLWPGSALPH